MICHQFVFRHPKPDINLLLVCHMINNFLAIKTFNMGIQIISYEYDFRRMHYVLFYVFLSCLGFGGGNSLTRLLKDLFFRINYFSDILFITIILKFDCLCNSFYTCASCAENGLGWKLFMSGDSVSVYPIQMNGMVL